MFKRDPGFGLPIRPACRETYEARAWRKADARWRGEIILVKLFSRLKNNLGNSETARLFEACIKRCVGRGERVSRNPAHDDFLLQAFEGQAASTGDRESAPREAAEIIDSIYPGKHGNSATAIEKRIRRLLKAEAGSPGKQKEPRGAKPRRTRRLHKASTKSMDK